MLDRAAPDAWRSRPAPFRLCSAAQSRRVARHKLEARAITPADPRRRPCWTFTSSPPLSMNKPRAREIVELIARLSERERQIDREIIEHHRRGDHLT